MPSFCIVDLHVALNNIKILGGVMQMQQWFPFSLLLSYKIFCTAVNIIKVCLTSREVTNIFV
jgi:hypothetical protein